MRIDLLAGTVYAPPRMSPRPTILVFDSGVGGLTVFSELAKARPDARFVYAADDAGFPYGRLSEAELVARVLMVMERLVERHAPDLVVIACNTASTLVLPPLRQRFAIPFVGTVPAVKPAAALSRSRRIAVLATPGTVARDYTRGLVETYAKGCAVTLVGSWRLAALAEAELTGAPGADADILAEIAPCFVAERGRAHRRGGARLHPLSAPPAALRTPRPLAGDLDRSGAGDRPPGGAAHRGGTGGRRRTRGRRRRRVHGRRRRDRRAAPRLRRARTVRRSSVESRMPRLASGSD